MISFLSIESGIGLPFIGLLLKLMFSLRSHSVTAEVEMIKGHQTWLHGIGLTLNGVSMRVGESALHRNSGVQWCQYLLILFIISLPAATSQDLQLATWCQPLPVVGQPALVGAHGQRGRGRRRAKLGPNKYMLPLWHYVAIGTAVTRRKCYIWSPRTLYCTRVTVARWGG